MDWTPNGWGDVLAVLGVLALALKVFDWRVRSHIDNRLHDVRDQLAADIEKHTKQIRAGYRNNGESLADIAHELKRLRTHLGMEEA